MREAGSTVAESLVVLYRVGTHQIRRRRRQLDRRRARGVLNPCARESKARTGRFPREKLMFDHGLISSYEDQQQEAANGQDSWGFFKDAKGFGRLDAGSRPGFTSSTRPPPPWTSVFQFSLFLYDVCGLEKLGLLVDEN